MRVSIIVLALMSASSVALAQSDQDWKLCKADDADELAIPACTRLLETNGLGQEDRAIAYYNRGAASWRKRNFDAAIVDEDAAIELDPKLASAYMRRSAAYGDKGDDDRGVSDATRAIELDPENVRAYSNRELCASAKGIRRSDRGRDEGDRDRPEVC